MKLIFNADDFGYSKGVNAGIIEAHQHGLVRSTTVMAGKPGFSHAMALARQNPDLRVGVHLTLSSGKSVGGPYQTLTDRAGNFPGRPEIEHGIRAGQVDLREVEAEYEAQIQKVLAADIAPDHFDGHHHLQTLPGVAEIFSRLAQKYGVAVRRGLDGHAPLPGGHPKTTAAFEGRFYGDAVSAAGLKDMLASHDGESLEVMCHPGYVDHALYTGSAYHVGRVFELEVLTSSEMKDFVRARGYEICSFGDL